MGSCTRRHFILSTCFLQMMTIIERQLFDFLGYMWAPIILNFFQILFVIFGFYGAYHLKVKYIVTYLLWSLLWIGWNTFLICFYLNIGILDRDSDILNLGTGSVSWFEVNGYGCNPTYPTNITTEDPYRPIRPERVDDCFLDYAIVEIIQSGIQCALAIFGIIGSIVISYIFIDQDDRLKHVNKIAKHRQSLYSIEFGPSLESLRSRSDTFLDYDNYLDDREVGESSPKPMTPRRVKRRSVMARGSNSRHSTTSRRSHKLAADTRSDVNVASSSGTNSRSSTRGSRRKYQQNPVTKLLDQQQKQLQIQQHNNHNHQRNQSTRQNFGSFHHNSDHCGLTESNLQTLNEEIINRSIGDKSAGENVAGSLSKPNNNQPHVNNILPDPIYYNTNPQTVVYQQSWEPADEPPFSSSLPPPTVNSGHLNPSYQHSTTNLYDAEHVDEVYNNRPPSVRSSYSNFHGTRPLSSYLANINNNATENVFVGLPGASQQQLHANDVQYQLQHVPPSTPPLYQQHPVKQPNLSTPFIISSGSQQNFSAYQTASNMPKTATQNTLQKKQRTTSRDSIRSKAFLNNGPPAYNLNYHTPPDSETTM